ncbi:MAG: pseudouridine synthase [Treponemataceae bacterium]|nr:pseudouridine synthase [Treponemataceae bacterium]
MKILYQDKHIIVVNKSEGVLTVPYPGFRGHTIIGELTERCRKRGILRGAYKPYAVHRLDKDTSGVLVFAMTQDVQKKLMDNWQTIVKTREYVALAENPRSKKFAEIEDSGTIDAPLTKNAYHHSYVANNQKGKNREQSKYPQKEKTQTEKAQKEVSAITHYKVLKRGKNHTLFQLDLETGRTNQIRAHLSHIGYTIAGDELFHAKTNPFNRLCLHAKTLEFYHPVSGELLCFSEESPKSWETRCN